MQAPLCGPPSFFLNPRPGGVIPPSHPMPVHSGTQSMMVPAAAMAQAPMPSAGLVTAATGGMMPPAMGGWHCWQPYGYAI
eukprot:scaffold219142_cov28-Tisochrysis_lutea.AAC.2